MNQTLSDAAIRAIGTLSSPVFFAGRDGDSPARLTLHVARPKDRKALALEAQDALAKAGIKAQCKVREFDQRRLEKARSLQDLLPYFQHEAVVFDPTGSVLRAGALVRFTERLRSALGSAVSGVYLEAEGRTLFVVCRPEALSKDGKPDASLREAVEKKAAAVAESWGRSDAEAFAFPVRLCTDIPELPLVPVDRASTPAGLQPSWWSRIQTGMMVSGITALLGAASVKPAAAEGPAVSAPNAKLAAEGGVINGYWSGLGDGSLTLPVGHSFGVQADASGGVSHDRTLWGVAGQGFWRDPQTGLVGGFASHNERTVAETNQTVNANRYGGEGEYYFSRVTAFVAGGAQTGNSTKSGFVTPIVSWYPQDNFKLSLGADIHKGTSLALLGAEYQFGAVHGLSGLSVFADAGISDGRGVEAGQQNGYTLAGFRYYFGPTKTLIRRHREDDPPSFVGGETGGIPGITPVVSGPYTGK